MSTDPFHNVTPIRPDLEPVYVDQALKRDMIRALNRDVEQLAREAREKGRIEGCIAMSIFVIGGLMLATWLA